MFKNLFQMQNATEDRKNAFVRFEELGLPTKSNEAWKYTSLKPLQTLKPAIPSHAKSHVAVDESTVTISCVNGYFDISAIQQALGTNSVLSVSDAILKNKISNFEAYDSFSALNSAFYQDGLYLTIGTTFNKPIVIQYVVENGASFINPRIYIEMKAESSLEFAEIFDSKSSDYLMNSSLHVNIGERASFKGMKYYKESYQSSHVDNITINQADSSSCQMIQLSNGSQLLRQNLEVSVDGKNANTDLRGISILEKNSLMDNFVKIHHKAPESTSRQAFKSILRDQAHYVFQGNIRIEKDAQRTDSDQVNRNLMLGQKCHVDTKPQLDVFADDVKATHGAAIGQLNADERFYLESRSISPEKALDMLCAGFALDLLEDLKSKWIQNYLRKVL